MFCERQWVALCELWEDLHNEPCSSCSFQEQLAEDLPKAGEAGLRQVSGPFVLLFLDPWSVAWRRKKQLLNTAMVVEWAFAHPLEQHFATFHNMVGTCNWDTWLLSSEAMPWPSEVLNFRFWPVMSDGWMGLVHIEPSKLNMEMQFWISGWICGVQ